ncbi:hypothetical protein [Halovenus marina]|uniref:hypothetical protein n=1 Tax=Halovenus marina TaxID=3396621 RepID=UPI003F55603A
MSRKTPTHRSASSVASPRSRHLIKQSRRTRRVLEAGKSAGIDPVFSARSGETPDTAIVDLVVGLDAGRIKIGSLARSKRLAKYNRLLEIERSLDCSLEQPFKS